MHVELSVDNLSLLVNKGSSVSDSELLKYSKVPSCSC